MVEQLEERTTDTSTQTTIGLDDPMDLSHDDGDGGDVQEDIDFEAMIDESFNEITRGEIITGIVLKVSTDEVVVDIGSKSEGMIPLHEFLDDGKDPNIFVGQEVEVMVLRREGRDGQPVLSRSRAKEQKTRERLQNAFKNQTPVDCVIKGVIKGGFDTSLDGVRAFMPHSQLGMNVKTDEERNSIIGQTISVRILELRPKRDLVVSQRVLLDEQRKQMRQATLENLKPGAKVTGLIKSITQFGAFVDLGGVDGLLHINDISWARIGKPQEVITIGSQLEVLVLTIEGDRISVGLKQLSKNPWDTVHEKYPEGKVLSGKVTKLEKFGAFVELEEGIEGLVHISEMSWTKRLKHPSEEIKVDEVVQVKILGIDDDKKRISLSYRQTEVDPWTLAYANHPSGSVVEGKVTGMKEFGAFVRLPEGIDGMIHVSDMSWEKRVTTPKQVLNIGDVVKAKVLEIVPEEKRISLGLKQLEADPWVTIAQKYKLGSSVEVKVTRVTDFGAFVELEPGVEGLAHVSTLSDERGKSPNDFVKPGEIHVMKIIKFDLSSRKIGMSLKDYVKEQEKKEVQKYMSEAGGGNATLGEMLGEQMKKLMNASADTKVSTDEVDFFQRKTEDEE
jgi:small subunit ribosomal protein S1